MEVGNHFRDKFWLELRSDFIVLGANVCWAHHETCIVLALSDHSITIRME